MSEQAYSENGFERKLFTTGDLKRESFHKLCQMFSDRYILVVNFPNLVLWRLGGKLYHATSEPEK
jgi:hypothetical protein